MMIRELDMKKTIIFLSAALLFLTGCHPKGPDTPEQKGLYYANYFAYNMMGTYYLWIDEISEAFSHWGYYDDPIQKVYDIRYKDSAGEDIDKWTRVTDDFSSLAGSVSGNTKTYGLDYSLYYSDETRKNICAVVRYTYAGSPAADAGLKRGDIILKINGKTLTESNYYDIIVGELSGGDHVLLTLADGREISLDAVQMYENPIGVNTIFDTGSKRIGYLHYTNFTLDSCKDLQTVFRHFKESGVTELILDLRYNTGGYAATEAFLASMIAPEKEVTGKSVFTTEVHNKKMSEEDTGDAETRFSTTHGISSGGSIRFIDISNALLAPSKVYFLVSESSASASESLIGGLAPYIDMTVIGTKTYGKYCSGLIVSAKQWYEAAKDQIDATTFEEGVRYTDNWGIYVMYGRYADKDGKTLSMPDGIEPDILLKDNPLDGHELGSPAETMLAKALSLAGYEMAREETTSPAAIPVQGAPTREGFRVRTLPR